MEFLEHQTAFFFTYQTDFEIIKLENVVDNLAIYGCIQTGF